VIARELVGQVRDPLHVATTLVRIGVCHYLVPSADEDQLLDQLRSAVNYK
jgi:hypothetical protein